MKIDHIIKTITEEPGSAFFYTPAVYQNSKSFCFKSPVDIVTVSNSERVEQSLQQIDEYIKRGFAGFGTIAYECGYLFEKRLVQKLPQKDFPYLNFYFFNEKDVTEIDSDQIFFPEWENDFGIKNFSINTDKQKFIQAVNSIKNYIAEGDTYQVNFTVKGKFHFSGNFTSLFKQLVFNQSARYTAFINTGNEIIISLSPELFFRISGKQIIAMPMKGTIKRGYNFEIDLHRRIELWQSEKDRAENLMIVDLLRNDLGRVSTFGSVNAENLFLIEKYESLYQMISEVSAELNTPSSFSEIIKNIFPCGSITGAPKIRTMEIIKELENDNRGVYTGAIGLFNRKEIVFNVPIRTLVINPKTGEGEIGLGSGIVWDSDPEKEYEETLLKSSFLLNPLPYFELFETMLVENGKIFLLDEHLKRLNQAAEYFLFKFDFTQLSSRLNEKLSEADPAKKYKLKLLLTKQGRIKIELADFPANPEKIKIKLSVNITSSADKFRYFKTSNRKMYDDEYSAAVKKGFFDIIFMNEKNQITEGAITNLFIRKGNEWITPPVNCGLLPGVFRQYWLKENPAVKEKIILDNDLKAADEIILTNSLRKTIKVDKLYFAENDFISFT